MPTINSISKETVALPPGYKLAVVASAVSLGTIFRLGDSHGDPAQGATPISAGQTKTFGPYSVPARFDLACAAGSLTYSVALANASDQGDARIAASLDAGTPQVITATIVGTIEADGEGNAEVIVTGAALGEASPVTLAVAVANGDTASDVAGKIRTALEENEDISAVYTVGGSGAEITLTAKVAAALDQSMNLAYADDTCVGLVADDASVLTTAGVAPGTLHEEIPQPAAAVAPLTDSTTGAPGDTLAPVGDTSAGDESEAINDNFASLNQQIEDLKASLVASGVLTEYVEPEE
jgi:hypothetical protein